MSASSLYIGTTGWSYPEWAGRLYAADAEPGQFLELYAREFNAVEINRTYFEVPPAAMVEGWRRRAPDGFYFCPLAPKAVTYAPDLKNTGAQLSMFLKTMEHLGGKLGPILFEFPAELSMARYYELEQFLKLLPGGFRYALETRNREMKTLGVFNELMLEIGIAPVVTAFPGVSTELSEKDDFHYVRWTSLKKHASRASDAVLSGEIGRWAHRIAKLIRDNRIIFGFFSNQYTGYAPGAARDLLDGVAALMNPGTGER